MHASNKVSFEVDLVQYLILRFIRTESRVNGVREENRALNANYTHVTKIL